MISRIDHIAIAVKDYDRAFRFFTEIMGAVPGSAANDGAMKYLWQNLSLGDLSRLELLQPTGKGSFLDNFLENKDGGVHHITLQTPDIIRAREILEQKSIPYFGFKSYGQAWKELFIHPRDAFGVLIQIAEFKADDWIAAGVRMPSGRKFIVRKDKDGAAVTFAHPGGGKMEISLDRDEVKELINELQKWL